ncbi:hypothetical protein IMG5_076640 [Ichthyophthirius multifiliis]|uniref:Tetratricopeptide repeat protein 29 n=1 Tax=Ichthyophthirius multifiliis TaxID=5932 RepID=G0QQ74_ICHMU|nr:hypothetical protein IMG5_076640 [Ichthyophthirius multifiliis]EGR32634.1 hypothetical protein IMG5_076640 [Ichthyophthirius multifiliis]|eukprot:XP_004036620.1 hypothetical protein IMG5_076640 [Ichthyophthirius multifiliis]
MLNFNNEKRVKREEKYKNSNFRISSASGFKKKPLTRLESDFQMYKEIFVAPKEQKLEDLKEKEKNFENLFHEDRAKQYDKILHIFNEEKQKMTQTLKNEAVKHVQENLEILEQILQLDQTHPKEEYFFDQQIQVQPPDFPNATVASPLTPGNGYAPSIPLTQNFKQNKMSIKDLLVRAKAGMQAGDIQKEAHLSFYLGMVYENNKQYQESIRFYKQFFTCARMMEDKIGLSLGANRIAVNYFNAKNYEKSIEYHQQNLELSDQENTFAAHYNMGITFRKIGCFEESVENLNNALLWAKQKQELESECLAYGQLGVTFIQNNQYEQAHQNFGKCQELAKKIKNQKLQLDCLLHITKIMSQINFQSSNTNIQILKDAVECAYGLDDKKTASLCFCNLGILEGNLAYIQSSEEANKFENEIEDVQGDW